MPAFLVPSLSQDVVGWKEHKDKQDTIVPPGAKHPAEIMEKQGHVL
jgi:hypothetical protein